MLDIFSWQHIGILLVVALVVVGPKDLPRLMHMAGKWASKARAMAGEFRKSFDEMARQTELDELRKEIEDLKKNNPITDVAGAVSDVQSTVTSPVGDFGTASVASEPRGGEFVVTDSAAVPEPSKGSAVP